MHKIKQYIEHCANPEELYPAVRNMLTVLDGKGRYPEDREVKELQRLCDSKHCELTCERSILCTK